MAADEELIRWASNSDNWKALVAKLHTHPERMAATELMKKARDRPDELTKRDLRRLEQFRNRR